MIELRPFQKEDWGVLLDLANLAVPFAPEDNEEWLEYRKAFDESVRNRRHYIATDGGIPVGYGCLEQQGDDPQQLRVFVVCSPESLPGEIGSRLYERLLKDAKELGATLLWAREFQQDAPIREFLTERGFVEVQRFTLPDQLPMVVYILELDPA
jgi:N-acetylglutamate synthase-like GNAT family acetyltransferase